MRTRKEKLLIIMIIIIIMKQRKMYWFTTVWCFTIGKLWRRVEFTFDRFRQRWSICWSFALTTTTQKTQSCTNNISCLQNIDSSVIGAGDGTGNVNEFQQRTGFIIIIDF
jgi:hypothetical protein